MTYRVPQETCTEVRDWDIILMHGSVRVMGMSHDHLRGCFRQEFGGRCKCYEQPRISSPVVCPNTRRPLVESWWSTDEPTGEARHLLEATDGTEVPVLSDKVYRLVGPRNVEGYDSYACGSIFHVYALSFPSWPPRPPRPTLWARLLSMAGLR